MKRKRTCPHWTPEEEEILREHYLSSNRRYIMRLLKPRSARSIQDHAYKLKLCEPGGLPQGYITLVDAAKKCGFTTEKMAKILDEEKVRIKIRFHILFKPKRIVRMVDAYDAEQGVMRYLARIQESVTISDLEKEFGVKRNVIFRLANTLKLKKPEVDFILTPEEAAPLRELLRIRKSALTTKEVRDSFGLSVGVLNSALRALKIKPIYCLSRQKYFSLEQQKAIQEYTQCHKRTYTNLDILRETKITYATLYPHLKHILHHNAKQGRHYRYTEEEFKFIVASVKSRTLCDVKTYSLQEVADALRVNTNHLERFLRRHPEHQHKMGRYYLFTEENFQSLLNAYRCRPYGLKEFAEELAVAKTTISRYLNQHPEKQIKVNGYYAYNEAQFRQIISEFQNDKEYVNVIA